MRRIPGLVIPDMASRTIVPVLLLVLLVLLLLLLLVLIGIVYFIVHCLLCLLSPPVKRAENATM